MYGKRRDFIVWSVIQFGQGMFLQNKMKLNVLDVTNKLIHGLIIFPAICERNPNVIMIIPTIVNCL